ncbi:Carboxypeptidase regulatory-like domain-containing protein [Lysobacter sp. yr284]|uniref:TonB-dependent receptor n=1 Tax=Lysobacter TaxID=68 RepID=UPI000896E5F1|nr:TonB-dependent receptor [Lysobacter sp. yr284]SDY33862.1 Carboxypeptidase regulatory-like domain-containing protein [Lysobacter sp. yr284]
MTYQNRVRMSKLTLGLLAVLATAPAFAQSTSAGVNGTVTSANGQPVVGAEVTITHVESGTVSRATTDASGRYNARGLRVGGPYTINITKEGEGTKTEDGVYLDLAKSNTINAALSPADVTTLGSVTAVATGGSELFSATKMGSGTNVTRQTIEALPSIGGNIQDYVRLDPRVAYVNRAEGGITAGGQNPRYNAIRIDGVSASDTFGLEGNNMPTRRQPVSMEAIEGINVDLASYDVTITGATGAVVDAVTKSGTNEFHGSIYGSYRDGGWFGKDPTDTKFNGFDKEETYGATFGGPLVKDKLFFFANYEKFKQAAPGADIPGSALGRRGAVITQNDLSRAQTISSGYGFDAGGLGSSGNTDLEEYALKIDWNISDAHRASLRYSKLDQSKLRINGINSSQISLNSYWYQHTKSVESWVGQLFSDWTDNFSTEFKVSYRDYSAVRETPGTAPSVRIWFGGTEGNPGGDSLFLGTESNSQANKLYTKTWNAFGSGTLALGDHNVKFGFDYSNNDVYNLFGPQVYGVYEFWGLDNYQAGRWLKYDVRTPQPGAGIDSVAGAFKYKQYGLFIQDEWFVNNNLTVNFGLRADKPEVNKNPDYNPLVQQVFGYDTRKVLNSKWLIQPRVGFNYTFDSERPTQLRGGFGLFQGESPQVWLTNAYNTTGLNYIQYSQNLASSENWQNLKFNGDGLNPPIPSRAGSQLQNVNVINPDFEQPSVWKANLAFEHELPWYGVVGSAELLVTKVKNALFYRNLNLGTPQAQGQDGRDLFWSQAANLRNRPWSSGNNRFARDRRFDQVLLLDNTDKGETQQFTVGLSKPFGVESDWSWSLAYTYTHATEVSGLTSSTATSGWNYNYLFDANEETASTSRYQIKDRIIGTLDWKHKFFGDYETRVGLVYEGRSGRPFSYVYSNDVNGDNRSGNDLFYVPSGPGDVLFGSLSPAGQFTADPAMEKRFFDWLASNPELGRYAGRSAPQNAGRARWVNTFDVRISQELPGFFKDHKSEIWLDIQNVGNLINKDWGHIYDYGFFASQRVAAIQGMYNGKYVYNFATPDAPTVANADADGFNVGVSQWSVQLGFRYKF